MKIRQFSLFILLLLATSAVAQYPVSGTLIEEGTAEPLGFATIQLFHQTDSSFVAGTTSNEKGFFSLPNVRSGRYHLVVSFVGLAPYSKSIRVKEAALPLGNISLGAGDNYLDEVLVKGVAAQVSVTNDTLEYNAIAFKVTQNAVTEDLLKKMPGIEIDSEGRVFVNGEEVKKVRINGKRFFGDNTKMATKNLPADLIDKIQIIDEQSEMAKLTGFEDGETTKMINITIRDDRKKGMFSHLYSGVGASGKREANGILNSINGDNVVTVLAGSNNTNNSRFEGIGDVAVNIPGMRLSKRQMSRGITSSDMIGGNIALDINKALKLEGNYSFGAPTTRIEQVANRITFLTPVQYYDRNIHTFRSTKTHTMNFRLEWKPDKKTTLIVRPNLVYSSFTSSTQNYYTKITELGDSLSRGFSLPSTDGNQFRPQGNITFSRRLAKRGRSFTLQLRGDLNNTDIDGIANTFNLKYRKGLPGTRSTDTTGVNQVYTSKDFNKGYFLRASFVEPITRIDRIELAVAQRLNKTSAEKLSYDFLEDLALYADTASILYSNIMESSFTNFQISLNYKRFQKKYKYTFGIKFEPSSLDTRFLPIREGLKSKEDVKRNVFNFSPSANVVYNFHKKKYLKIDYRGYTMQPTAAQLQPAEDRSNPTFYRSGNPDLNPRYTHSLKATYSAYKRSDFSLLNANINGVFHQNAIVNRTEYIDEAKTIQLSMPVNVSGVYNVFGNLLYNKPFFNNSLIFNTNTPFALNNHVGFTKVDNQKEYVKNNIKTFRIGEKFKVMHQNNWMELGLGGEISYVRSRNDVNDRQNSDTYDWEYFGNFLFRLPSNITLSTDIAFSYRRGYFDAFNMDEIIWDAEVEKLVFKNKKGILSLKLYDILKQRISIFRSVGANYVDDSDYNTLKSYFLICFAYKFDFWKK